MTSNVSPHASPHVYIVLVNWNGWKDTLECLESVFRNDYPGYTVVVCDNCSSDGSYDHIKAWAGGHRRHVVAKGSPHRGLSLPPVEKPISYLEANSLQARPSRGEEPPLVLIQNAANLGFAGGNNAALRYVLRGDDFEYVWFLNNDTVIDGSALSALVGRMLESPGSGICGSTILDYRRPTIVQGMGGAIYNKWFGTNHSIGRGRRWPFQVERQSIEEEMDYVIGASMLVSKKFLQSVGFMCEDYFLYFEEIDWATRGKRLFSLAYAPNSLVYHKEGISVGTHEDPRKRSTISEYYAISNRLFFSMKFFPIALPSIYVGLLLTLINRIRRGQWDRARMVLRIAFSRPHRPHVPHSP